MWWPFAREVLSLHAPQSSHLHLLQNLRPDLLTCKNWCHLLIKINKNNEILPVVQAAEIQTAVRVLRAPASDLFVYLFSSPCWASVIWKLETWNAPKPKTFLGTNVMTPVKIYHPGALLHARNFKILHKIAFRLSVQNIYGVHAGLMLIFGFYLHYIYQYKYKNIPNSEKETWNPKYFWYKQFWIELILQTLPF